MRGFDEMDRQINGTMRLAKVGFAVCAIVSLGLMGVVVWAIIALVRHFVG